MLQTDYLLLLVSLHLLFFLYLYHIFLYLEYLYLLNCYYLFPFYNPICIIFASSSPSLLILRPNLPSTITASPSPIFTPFTKTSSGSFTICSSSIISPISHFKISFKRTTFVPNLTLNFNLTLCKSSRFFGKDTPLPCEDEFADAVFGTGATASGVAVFTFVIDEKYGAILSLKDRIIGKESSSNFTSN